MPTIRDADGVDAPALLELALALTHEVVSGPPKAALMTAERLRSDIAEGRACGLVAESAGTIVGFALYSYMHFSLSGEHLYLDDLYVQPDQRGTGLGRDLMTELAVRARARGCAGMTWFVERENIRAIRFYQRLGAGVAESRAIMSSLDLDGIIDRP